MILSYVKLQLSHISTVVDIGRLSSSELCSSVKMRWKLRMWEAFGELMHSEPSHSQQSMPELSAALLHLATALEPRHLEEFVCSHTRLHGVCHVTGQIISYMDC